MSGCKRRDVELYRLVGLNRRLMVVNGVLAWVLVCMVGLIVYLLWL